jgi:MFS family permease
MQLAVLVLFATRDLALSAGAIGLVFACGGLGCVVAASFAERLAKRHGVGSSILLGLILTVVGWQAFGLVSGPAWFAAVALGAAMFVFDFGAILWGINYLALRQAITPDRLLGRMTATMRFLTVAAAPAGSLAGGALATAIGLRYTLLAIAALGVLLAAAAVAWSPVRRHRTLPVALAD